MQRMRQNSGLRNPEEMQRAMNTARLGLSEMAGSRPSPDLLFDSDMPALSLPAAAQTLDLSFRDAPRASRSFSTRAARMASYRARGVPQLVRNPEVAHAGDGEIDVFHDCMDVEENAANFSNMFDDLDLEGTEPRIEGDSLQREAPVFDPVAPPAVGSSSARGGLPCKRKSCNIPAASAPHGYQERNEAPNFPGQRPSLVLPPPTMSGASSSRSTPFMEGPRPQKTRLSSDLLEPSGTMFASPDFNPSEHQRGARRAESFRARPPVEYTNPDSIHLAFPAARDGNVPFAGTARGPRTGPGMVTQGLTRRMGRTGSSRSFLHSPASHHREQSEGRARSIRMACLENGMLSNAPNAPNHHHGSSVRRGGANYMPTPRNPSVAEGRHGYSGRSSMFSRLPPPQHNVPPPQAPISLLDAPEMRSTMNVFDGFRPPAFARRELVEGFMALPTAEFDWEHRPRLMAGGLAEIMRALERVERDEDLTREQLMMLEATTFLFGGIGLHDDHSDWRLDIDNMSYEELLALGDRIGTVSTGLSEEVIAKQLEKSVYAAAFARSSEDSDIKCCICQEEFEEEVELGTIKCGHNYHTECIRQWLIRKNTCPICKATALPEPPEPSSPPESPVF